MNIRAGNQRESPREASPQRNSAPLRHALENKVAERDYPQDSRALAFTQRLFCYMNKHSYNDCCVL